MKKAFAWAVHAYTALGLVCAAGMAVLIIGGGDASFRSAFALMMIATAVDATDGWLARKAHVKDVLPGFDGRALDDLIDFHTYTSLPLLLLWRAGILPASLSAILLMPLLASAYGFSQVNAKTDDGFFLGFPSYWNIVAFYLYMMQPSPYLSAAVLVTFSVLTFVPTRYLYATRGGPHSEMINVGAVVWFAVLGAALIQSGRRSILLTELSLMYPAMYLTLSVHATRTHRSIARS